jgi:phosphoesterase RecJ-like protein
MRTPIIVEILKAKEWLHGADHICVVSHESPDGDAVGSVLGMTWALRAIGKKVSPSLPDDVPTSFSFLPGSEDITKNIPLDADMIVAVDAADLDRLGALVEKLAAPVDINIDHHISNTGFAHINIVDGETAATAEYLTRLLPELALSINDKVAKCLLTGIVTDTLGFRTTSTRSETMSIAHQLMQHDVSLHDIYQRTLHRRSYEATKLWGQALGNVCCEDGLVWTQVTLEGKAEIGYTAKGDADVVSQLTAIEGTEVAIVFVERMNSEVKISWRALNGVDVSDIAGYFGGGGHQAAAGANIYGTNLDRAQTVVLERTREAMHNYRTRDVH